LRRRWLAFTIFYVVIYAIWLKHSMPRNIVISGSAA
jgi:heme O synthase-like polyprenyltransferase